ncbi:hypothetical protein B0H11DRAFT_1898657 [Mycena galericulata]|nr:hypothetical protein B0H11DRAFT_1898657 [Mycena galericulata]
MSMASRPSSAERPESFSETATSILNSTILPALNLAKAGVTGIGVPGVEPIINGVLELATMVSTMKANKEDILKLEKSLNEFSTINVSGASDDLKHRVSNLTLNLQPIALECGTLAGKKGFRQLLTSKDQKQKIQSLMNIIATHIRDFTLKKWLQKV